MSARSHFHNSDTDIATRDSEENVLLFEAESNHSKDIISEFHSVYFKVMVYTESLICIEKKHKND